MLYELTIYHYYKTIVWTRETIQAPFLRTIPTTATMSAEYQNQDPIKLAEQAERDLNSGAKKTGNNAASDSGMCTL